LVSIGGADQAPFLLVEASFDPGVGTLSQATRPLPLPGGRRATEELNMTYAERSIAGKPARYMLVAVGVAIGFSATLCAVMSLVL
jgi:hypothetical protein